MQLSPDNARDFLLECLPPGCRIERSTIFRGDIPIAIVVVNEAGVYVNSFYFPYGEIPKRRINGMRRWLSQ